MGMSPMRIIVVLLGGFLTTSFADVSIKFENNGGRVNSGDSVFLPATLKLTCEFTPPSTSSYAIVVRSKSGSGGNYTPEAQCLYVAGTKKPQLLSPSSIKDIIVNNDAGITCLDNGITFQLRIADNKLPPEDFSCAFNDYETLKIESTNSFLLYTHTKPSAVKIAFDATPLAEGDQRIITCDCSAKPPPKLQLKIGGVLQERVSFSPPNITLSSPFGTSRLTYTATISKDMNDKEVICETVDHPYTETMSAKQILDVTYGPSEEQTADDVKVIDLSSVSSPQIMCQMDANPSLKYEWYYQNTKIETAQNLTIPKDHYSNGNFPLDLTYSCKGTNPMTVKSARKTYRVQIDRLSPSTTETNKEPQGGESKEVTKGALSETAIIAIAVVFGVVGLIIIIVILVCCIKKCRNSSSGNRAKAKQARTPSTEDRNEDHMKYQSNSTSSLNRANDQRFSNYHENPTLPMEYRYSQGDVKQLEDVIDSKPRSRKPVALEDLDRLDSVGAGAGGPPPYGDVPYGEVPPAYTNSLMSLPQSQYSRADGYMSPGYADNSYYGAPC